jgi:Tfp pilus assembly protein PilV
MKRILRNAIRDSRGFSIVEAMVASSMILITFMGLSQVVYLGRNLLDLEEDRRKAALVLQSALDGIRSDVEFDQITSMNDTNITVVVDNLNYEVAYSVRTDTPELNTVTIDVSVVWDSSYKDGSVSRTLTASAILARSDT